jgi:8-oxoguanine deaminase
MSEQPENEKDLLLIENCRIVACFDDAGTELDHADILIEGTGIKAVGRGLRDSLALAGDIPTIDGRGHVALPGFVNVHHHFWQTLTRVTPRVQNAKLFEWLVEQYQLWEALDEEGFYHGARVAMAELLLTGCTTTSDHHYLFPTAMPVELIDIDIRAARELGIRFNPTRGAMTLGEDSGGLPPMSVIEKDERVLEDYERLISKYHDRSPHAMTRIALAPCAPFNVTPFLFQETVNVARRHGVKIHTHLAETADEDVYCMERFGKRPYDVVADQGWEGPDVWFAHCVKINSAEIERFARHGVSVAHCPSANCRLGSGIAPVPEMLRGGVNVGFGVDGSASNDSGDLLGEARLAFLLHRSVGGHDAISPRDCLRMLTRGGAAVLGNDHIGRLEPGAAADVVLFNIDKVAYAGGASTDPLAALIMCGTSHHVDWSIINGRIVVERGRIQGLAESRLVAQANAVTDRLMAHGLKKRGIDYRQHVKW